MTPHDPTSPKQPLDADEQALANRLARIGPYGEPSPTLDSKIMASAHAAVGQQSGHGRPHKGSDGRRISDRSTADASRSQRKHRPRWSLGLGIAASLVLAIGLAWQMRPLPDATPAYRSEAESALASPPLDDAQSNKAAAAQHAATGADQPAPTNDNDVDIDDSARVQRDDTLPDAPSGQLRAFEALPAAPAPAPPAPSLPASPMPTVAASAPVAPEMDAAQAAPAAEKAAADQARNMNTRQAAAAEAGAAARASAAPAEPTVFKAPPQVESGADAMSVEVEPTEVLPIEDVPPATVASPVVRDAWLARIRELASHDRLQEARASLREFIVRYPQYPLAPDLRALRDAFPDDVPEGSADRNGPARDEAARDGPAAAGDDAPGS